MKEKSVIWIDDDRQLVTDFIPLFLEYGVKIIPCYSIGRGLEEVMRGSSGNILLDVDFHGNRDEGLIFLEQIRVIHPYLRVVIFTGYPEISDSVRTIKHLMASDYIAKPIPIIPHLRDEFFERLHEAFEETSERTVTTKKIHDNSLGYIIDVRKSLETGDVPRFISILQTFFASLSYNMKVTEAYFHGYIVIILKLLGMDVEPESETNLGRIDAVVGTDRYIYLMEFKLSDANIALQQIKDRKYFQKYFMHNQEIILLGIAFDRTEKNISGFLNETYKK